MSQAALDAYLDYGEGYPDCPACGDNSYVYPAIGTDLDTWARKHIKSRSAHKSYLTSHTIKVPEETSGWDGLLLLKRFSANLQTMLRKYKGLKIHFAVNSVFIKKLPGVQWDSDDEDSATPAFTDWTTDWTNTPVWIVTRADQVNPLISEMIERLRGKITESALKGSRWVFYQAQDLDLHVARYHPLGGSGSRAKTPPKLYSKKATINVENQDEECFKFAVLASLNKI